MAAAAAGHSHDHHDHSNCNHDHGSHGGDAHKASAATDEIALRQQAADKLTKDLAELQEIANAHKKLVSSKSSTEAVNKTDVDLLIKEMQVTKADAEAALRANKCDLVATLTALVKQ